MDKTQFLKKYHIAEEDFTKSRCDWNDLMKIKSDYELWKIKLETPAIYFAESLRSVQKVHSVKLRIKEPEHLIEKVIRIQKENAKLDISVNNYRNRITDLIGARVLHLFKEDWIDMHKFIIKTWKAKKKPIAYHRQGDNLKLYKDNDCKTSVHEFGYRSVHYLLESEPSKVSVVVEVQVRTIFEEAWSEIDHVVRYPQNVSNVLLADYLKIFNRLAGSADEMGSYVRFLKEQIYKKEQEFRKEIKSKNETISKLQKKIGQLKISNAGKKEMLRELEELKKKEMEVPSIIPLSLNSLGDPIALNPLSDKLIGIDSLSNPDELFINQPPIQFIPVGTAEEPTKISKKDGLKNKKKKD